MSKSSDYRAFLLSCLLLGASGCASIAPSAISRLAAFDPLSAEPEKIAVAAIMPKFLRLRDGDVSLDLKIDAADPDYRMEEKFLLNTSEGTPPPGLPAISAEQSVQVVRIAPADIKRLEEAQQRARDYKKNSTENGKGSLMANVSGGCRTAPIPDGPLPLQLLMTTGGDSGFFPLTRQVDLRKMLGDDTVSKIPECEDLPAGGGIKPLAAD